MSHDGISSEVGGVSPTGKSFRFVRACVRASGRGEAKLRGRARDDVLCVARAPAGPVTPSGPPRADGGKTFVSQKALGDRK